LSYILDTLLHFETDATQERLGSIIEAEFRNYWSSKI